MIKLAKIQTLSYINSLSNIKTEFMYRQNLLENFLKTQGLNEELLEIIKQVNEFTLEDVQYHIDQLNIGLAYLESKEETKH